MIGIGLSVDNKGFNVAVLEKIEDKFIIKKLLHEDLEENVLSNGNVEMKEQFVSTLGKLVASNSLSKKRTALSYFNQKINFRNFLVPIMSEKELKKAVQWQIVEELAMPAEELVYDYSAFGVEENKYKILAVVAKKDDLLKFIALIMETGLSVGIIDLPNVASIYPISQDAFSEKGYSIIIDINYDTSDITFLTNDNISFIRNMNIGTKRLAETLARETPYKISEIIKDEELLEKNIVYFEDFYAAITSELQNSIWFYESNFIKNRSVGKINLEKLILNREAIKLPNFKEYINKIPILSEVIIDFWRPNVKLFETDMKIDWERYNTAIGLAMRSAEND
jgi:type IV pilus assembly protein PilM